mgnify:CR=1 FL=1
MKPAYDELVALLREVPPRQMIDDQRFWDFRRKVEALLARVEAGEREEGPTAR